MDVAPIIQAQGGSGTGGCRREVVMKEAPSLSLQDLFWLLAIVVGLLMTGIEPTLLS